MFAATIAVLICLSHGFMPVSQVPIECLVTGSRPYPPIHLPEQSPGSRGWLAERARLITVRVKTGQIRTGQGGSGILITRQGRLYTVLTNRHVTTPGAPYVIQTPDGRSYPANLLKKFNFRGTDLAMLQFRGQANYAIASLSRTPELLEGSPVLAAGFPLEPRSQHLKGLLITTGQISLIPPQPFQGGYQIGYTNLIHQGMSGGPLLNLQGEVIGINSLHAYPLWGDPYVFQDGSKPHPSQRQGVIQSSWAVPISRFQEVVRDGGQKRESEARSQKSKVKSQK